MSNDNEHAKPTTHARTTLKERVAELERKVSQLDVALAKVEKELKERPPK